MSKLSFRARALDASKPMPIYLAEELPDLPDYSAINRAVPQMPSGMEKEEESEHHLQRAISGSGLIIPTPEVCPVSDLHFYERCYPPDYKMPKQHIHMQPLWEEQEMPEYDMDSEDERWLRQQRHPDLTELLFEQMMDRLEKSSGQTVVTLSEAKLLLQRADDLVIAVYDYWLNKRLTTQHPLILSVKTESRPGQSSNNPYLAFRRRTEKMQTRKNRKNDESSYEKMLKLRRELARALALLQLVAKREQAKRELVALTGAVAERRHRARDYTEPPPPPPQPALHLPPAPPTAALPAQTTHSHHRTVYAPTSFRREPFTVQQFAPPIESRQKTLLSQREKRPYKRRKHRHHPVGTAAPAREGGASSSSEDSGGRDDSGPFAFRRRQGCYYQLPTSTLCGEPVPGTDLFEHELDPRHRYTLVSVSEGCVGFARRRVGRGGRSVLDRHTTPLDSLWAALPPPHVPPQEEPSDTIRYRSPKETWRDHTHSRYPWRKAFRRHLASHSHLWIDHVKGDTDDVTNVFDDVKIDLDDVKVDLDDIKMEIEESKSDMEKPSLPQDAVRWGGGVGVGGKAHAWDVAARAALRKRVHSTSDSSVDEQEPLAPVEREFSQFINEVNNEWLHFRPRSPPPPPPVPRSPSPPLPPAEPFAVELFPQLGGGGTLAPFCTDTITLQRLQGTTVIDEPTPPSSSECAYTVRVRDCTPPPLPRPPARTPPPPPPPAVPPPTVTAPAATTAPASSAATNTAHTKSAPPQAPKPQTPPKKAPPTTNDHEEKRDRSQKVDRPVPSSVPNSNIVVGANEVPHQIKVDKKKPAETIEEVIAVAGGVQLKTVQSVHSPLKKHIISARPPPPPAPAPRPSDTQTHTHAQAQAQSRPVPHDHLKVRLQNHLVTSGGCVVAHTPGLSVSSEAGSSGTVVGLINAPSVPNRRQHHTVASVASVSVSGAGIVGGGGGRRAPIVRPVQLAPSPAPPPNSTTPVVLSASHTIHHVAPNKLKVLHAHPLHPLTHTQAHAHPHRNHLNLLGGRGSIAQLPAVVSLGGGQALIKGSNALTQFIEIKGAPLGKGPHLVNVVRTAPAPTAPSAPPAPAPAPASQTTQQPLVCTDNKRRQLVFDTTRTALKGNIQAVSRGHRVSVPVEGRGGSVPVASIAGVRAPHVRHQIHLKGRTLVGGAAPGTKTAALSQAVVANLLHKNVQLPKGGQKIAIGSAYSGASVAGMGSVVGTMGGSVQTLTLSGAHLKARVHTPSPSHTHHIEVAESGGETASTSGTNNTDGTDTHRNNDTLPMEVT